MKYYGYFRHYLLKDDKRFRYAENAAAGEPAANTVKGV